VDRQGGRHDQKGFAVNTDPGRWVDRIIGWCFGILLAVIALYCAVALIEAMLPTLIIIVGAITIVGLIVGAIVVIRTWCNRW
jgi:hypothetical protein